MLARRVYKRDYVSAQWLLSSASRQRLAKYAVRLTRHEQETSMANHKGESMS